MNSEYPAPDKDELVKLRDLGWSRGRIADYYGVSIARVKRWISEMKIPAVTNRRSKSKIAHVESVELGDDDGLTLIERAKKKLGTRMTQDYRGYLLDGRLVRIDILLQAAGLKVREIH